LNAGAGGDGLEILDGRRDGSGGGVGGVRGGGGAFGCIEETDVVFEE